MLRHYVALALRNVARAKLYAAISIVGLAIGFGAATLIGLYVHDELSYERWIPDQERIYQVSASLSGVGPSDLGLWIASDFSQFSAVTRLFLDQAFFVAGDRPDFKANEPVVWADANVFDVFRFPVAAGSLDGALTKPDSLVLTRRIAAKYFGASPGAAIGKTLLYNGQYPMVVTAVIEDLPSSTHLSYVSILGAGHAPYSPAAQQDLAPIPLFGGKLWNTRTYGLLKANQSIAPVREGLKTLLDRHAPMTSGSRKASEIWSLGARPIRAIHLSSNSASDPDGEKYGAVYTVAAIGLLVLLVASINFVNLLTALGVRRALEVGVRKALGAQRSDLFAQFMTESYLYVVLGAALGLGIAALALRPLNQFVGRKIDFSMFAEPWIAVGALLFLAFVAFLAGVYPALVLSAFRPAAATKGGRAPRAQAGVRQVLVVLQFAILIALLISTGVTYLQMKLGMREALRQNTDPILLLQGGCNDALKAELLRQPGVAAAACSMTIPEWGFGAASPGQRGDREPVGLKYLPVDFGFFELHGYELAAGRLFSPDLGSDASPPDNVWRTPEALVLNETAVHSFGFATAEEAIGQTIMFAHIFRLPSTFTPRHDATIIGVLKDFQIGTVRDPITPAAFYVDPGNFRITSVKLDGRATPEALDAIDHVWNQYGGTGPPQRFFLDQAMQGVYVDLVRQTVLFSTFALIAVLIAVLGLIGLAAHAAVSRTKEIGIRKVLGGGRWTIIGLLLWQFSMPVLLANLIAWPAAYVAMHAWLGGFAKRVALDWWLFAGAGAITFAVAITAVLVHAWGMAGTRPVTALRYE